MSLEVGLRYPHRLAGIVGISGWVREPKKLMKELSPVARQQRLLMTHGTQDPMVPSTGYAAIPAQGGRTATRMARVRQGAHRRRRGGTFRHPKFCARRLSGYGVSLNCNIGVLI